MDLNDLKLGADVQTPSSDVIPGGSSVRDTGLFAGEIDMAYLSKSSGGAKSLVLAFREAGTPSTNPLRFTLWITSGDAKGNKNFYISPRDHKRYPLPGMQLANEISLIATGKPLGDLSAEKKVIKLRNWTTQQDEPTEVDCIVELLNKPVLLGLEKVQENRRVQTTPGVYVETPEMRTFNDIQKVFFPTGHTITEKSANADAEFVGRWKAKFSPEYVNNKYKAVAGGDPTPSSDALPWGGTDDKAVTGNGKAAEPGALFT